MKVLYLASRSPFPKVGGREYMIGQSLKFLTNKFETHLFFIHGKKDYIEYDNIKSLGLSSIHNEPLPNSINLIFNTLTRNRSIQENLYYSRNILAKINKVIDEVKPDVIVCDMLRMSQYIRNDIPLVVDLDDILSNRYRKMIEGNSSFSSLGTFADRLPKFINYFEKFFRNRVLKYEKCKILRAEKNAYQVADKIILTSPLEAEKLNEIMGSNKAIGIPQAKEIHDQCLELPSANTLLFIGNLTTAQNIASLKYIVKEILPRLDLKGTKVTLNVIGKYDSRTISIVSESKSVNLLGFVDDLDGEIKKSRVAIAIVSFGTGIKTKVLDSLALGIPTVTNSVGAEGLNIRPTDQLIVEDDIDIQVEEILRILNDDEYAKIIAESAKKFIRENHSNTMLERRYQATIESIFR